MLNSDAVYAIPTSINFEYETDGNYIFVDNWFSQLGKNPEVWLAHPNTKKSFYRINILTNEPCIKNIPINVQNTKSDQSKEFADLPELETVDGSDGDDEDDENDEDGPDDNTTVQTRLAVHKYAVSIALMFLNNTELVRMVNEKCPSNILVFKRCNSLHIKSTDMWFNATKLASFYEADLKEFIDNELGQYSDKFGVVAHSESTVVGGEERVIWFHPLMFLPLMLWIDRMAVFEVMGSYFSSEGVHMPNTDVIKAVSMKNKKNNE